MFPEEEGALDGIVMRKTNIVLSKARVKGGLHQPLVCILAVPVAECKNRLNGQSVTLDWSNEALEKIEQFVDVIAKGAQDAALVAWITVWPGCLLVSSWSKFGD